MSDPEMGPDIPDAQASAAEPDQTDLYAGFAGLDPDQPLAVAVSGGSDSLALLHLAAGWARAGLHVVTVDHGLRDVRAELDLVTDVALRLGCAHDVLRWQWDGQGNQQASARAGRYDAMASWAAAQGIGTVLLGHTMDDQAETVLMNLARGSGVDGLAGMEARSARGGVTWARPLLGLRRAALRRYLTARGQGWAEDPSNANPVYARVRARGLMAQLAPLGLTVARLAQTADHAAAARSVLLRAAADLFAAEGRTHLGDVILPARVLRLSDDTERRLLAEALRWVSGAAYRPRWSALSGRAAQLRSGADGARVTLMGCVLHRRAEALRISRELKAVEGPVPLGQIWDGRWRVTAPEGVATEGLRIAAVGAALSSLPDWRAAGLPHGAAQASPGIWREDALIAAPVLQNTDWRAEIPANFGAFLLSR